MPKNFIQGIADAITDALPDGVKNKTAEVEQRIKEGVDQALSNFKMAKQEEFEIQQKVLKKTREKLESLEKRVAELEERLGLSEGETSEIETESNEEVSEGSMTEEMHAYAENTDALETPLEPSAASEVLTEESPKKD